MNERQCDEFLMGSWSGNDLAGVLFQGFRKTGSSVIKGKLGKIVLFERGSTGVLQAVFNHAPDNPVELEFNLVCSDLNKAVRTYVGHLSRAIYRSDWAGTAVWDFVEAQYDE